MPDIKFNVTKNGEPIILTISDRQHEKISAWATESSKFDDMIPQIRSIFKANGYEISRASVSLDAEDRIEGYISFKGRQL